MLLTLFCLMCCQLTTIVGQTAVSDRSRRLMKHGPTTSDVTSASAPAEQRLIRHLLRHYDVDARGVDSIQSTVDVTIQLLLLRMQQLDERSQVLTTTGIVLCDWRDDRLQWNTVDFDNLSDVVMQPDRIWLPELALMNGAELLTPDFSRVRVLIGHTGHVHWEPGGVFTTTCDIDVRYFPFDDQLCMIEFGAWAYYSARVNITSAADNVSTHEFTLNGEWELYSTSAEWRETTLSCCPRTRYPYVQFALRLRRRYTFYVLNVVVPCALLSVLAMVGFCLPPDAGEKVSLGISVILAIIVFLLLLAETVPRTSLHVPLIVIYLTCTMALGALSVCLTVLVLNLHHRDSERPVPAWAQTLVLDYLARLLCVVGSQLQRHNAELDNQPADNMKTSLSARQVVQRPDVPSTSIITAERAKCDLYVDTLNVDCTSLRPSHVAATEDKDRSSRLPTESQQSANEDVHVPRSRTVRERGGGSWKELAQVLDRLFFWVMLTAMTSCTMIVVLAPVYKQHVAALQ